MSVNTVTVDQTLVVAANTEVTQSSAGNFQVLLPQIDAGAGATVAIAYEVRFTTTGFGGFEVLDFNRHRVGFVPGHSSAVCVAEAGENEAAGTPQQWRFRVLAAKPAATIVDVAAAPLLTLLTDTPASVDALRDEQELVNVESEVIFALQATAINAIIAALDGAGITLTE